MKMPHEYRQKVPGTCRQCGNELHGYKGKKWCSEACKQRAKYQRSKQK